MSKIKVQSPSSGTAVFTLTTASGTSDDRTITLPDSTATLVGSDTAVVKDASGNVGIGTSSPSGFEVRDTNIRLSKPSATAYRILLNDKGNDLAFQSSDSADGSVYTSRLNLMQDGRGLSQFTAKAWVQLNMSTPAIKDSHNHDTITDISTGHFIVSFTVNVANANYAVSTGVGQTDSAGTSNIASDSFRLFAYNTSGTLVDSTHCMAVTFGD